MSELILRILLSEIKTVRVICRSCGAIVEVEVADIPRRFENGACPFCQVCFKTLSLPESDVLGNFAKALQKLIEVDSKLGVEIVLPQDNDEARPGKRPKSRY